jgi:hypothetical protein
MDEDNEIMQSFRPLYSRFENMPRLLEDPPLLAHYTTIPVLEKILEREEVWFSNPLFMNDLQEMRFGLNEGAYMFLSDPTIRLRAGGTQANADLLEKQFQFYFTKFENEAAFDTYVFCLSEHARDDNDGLLSMWRGYGGHGNGAALIFNPGNINLNPNSIMALAQVSYASTHKRLEELRALLVQWSEISASLALPTEKLFLAAHTALSIIKTYALTTKHSGFSEEKEWRLIYLAEQDNQNLLKKHLGYYIGARGVEPKLKFKIEPIPGVTSDDIGLDKLLHAILLGPSLSSPLAVQSIGRMLEGIGKGKYRERLKASSIPLRPAG